MLRKPDRGHQGENLYTHGVEPSDAEAGASVSGSNGETPGIVACFPAEKEDI